MSFDARPPWRKRLSTRIGGWFALIFAVAMLVAGLIGHLLAARQARIEHESAALAELERWALVLDTRGLAAFEAEIDAPNPPTRGLFFRVLDSNDQEQVYRGQRSRPPIGFSSADAPGVSVVRHGNLTIARRRSSGQLVEVGIDARALDHALEQLELALFLTLGIASVLAVIGGWAVTARTLRPLQRLHREVRIVKGTGSRVTTPPFQDEIGGLATEINGFLDRNEAVFEEQRSSIEGIAHDLLTPLSRIRSAAELALSGHGVPKAALEDCSVEAERLKSTVGSLLDVSAARSGVLPLRPKDIDLVEIASDVIDLYALEAEDGRVSIVLDAQPVKVHADPTLIARALANLVDNAIKYSEPLGTVEVRVWQDDVDAVVTVRDEGIGVVEHEIESLWQPHQRGTNASGRRGHGLGLSVTKAIVEAHGGRVLASRVAEHGGSKFELRIPLQA